MLQSSLLGKRKLLLLYNQWRMSKYLTQYGVSDQTLVKQHKVNNRFQ